jgi:hypothetical protein
MSFLSQNHANYASSIVNDLYLIEIHIIKYFKDTVSSDIWIRSNIGAGILPSLKLKRSRWFWVSGGHSFRRLLAKPSVSFGDNASGTDLSGQLMPRRALVRELAHWRSPHFILMESLFNVRLQL